MRRGLLILFVLILLLLGLALGAVHWVLRSDLPRQWVLATLERQTGLRIEAKELRATWGGRTTLTDVKVTLPLEDEPLVSLPRLVVDHNSVPGLLFSGGAVRLDMVTLEQPRVRVEQRNGQWNVAEAIALIRQHVPQGKAGSAWPRVTVTDGRVTLAGPGGTSEVPVSLHGEPVGEVAWRFEAKLGEQGELSGRVTTSGDFAHDVTIDVKPTEALVRQWWADAMLPLEVKARWLGRVADESLAGRVELLGTRIADYRVGGSFGVTVREGELAIDLDGGVVEVDRGEGSTGERWKVVGGQAALREGAVTWRGLVAHALGAEVVSDGSWELRTRTGSLKGKWQQTAALAVPGVASASNETSVEHAGTVRVELTRPALDQIAAEIDLTSRGEVATIGEWDAIVTARGVGESWRELVWELMLPRLRLEPTGREPIVLDDLGATIETELPVLIVRELAASGEPGLRATGRLDLQTWQWKVDASATELVVRGIDLPPVTFALAAEGDAVRVQVRSLAAELPGITLEATGVYDTTESTPMTAEVAVTYAMNDAAVAVAAVTTDGQAAEAATKTAATDASSGWAGRWRWSGRLTGKPLDRELTATGTLASDAVVIRGQSVDAINMPLTAQLTGDRLTFQSQPFQAFGGMFSLNGTYIEGRKMTQLAVEAQDVSVTALAKFADPRMELTGRWSGSLQVTVPHEQLRDMRVEGRVSMSDFAAGALAFDHMQGELRTSRDIVRFERVELSRGEGKATGRAWFDLRDPHTIHAQLQSEDWPVAFGDSGIHALLNGSMNINVDVMTRQVLGEMAVQSRLADDAGELGRIDFNGALTLQSLQIRELAGQVLGAKVQGRALIDLVEWHRSSGDFSYENLTLGQLARWLGWMDDAAGRVSGTLTFGQATEPRALEPMRIDVTITGEESAWRDVAFTGGHITAFAGPRRLVVHEARFGVAEGNVDVWASVTRRAQQWFTNLHVDFASLNLRQLEGSLSPEGKPVEGRLAGSARFIGDLTQWDTAAGTVRVQLAESDLGGTTIIGTIFRAMGVPVDEPDPTGYGRVVLRIENAMVKIESFQFHNRGYDIQLHGTIDNLRLGMDSPILIFGAGSLRPFKHLPLPGSHVLDELFTTAQVSITTVRADGTLGDHRVMLVPLSEMSRTLRELLGVSEPERAGEKR